ncbi:molybdopterin-dependent oxidoreductase [Candidatus Saccharibacteria bacterium]|nr:molybdopterin-dependent oxidoreductase [Candidatus Saccharibacteria bacterium]
MARRISFCRNCQAACGVELEVEDNRVTSIRGDAAHPHSKGYLCFKGKTSLDHQNGEDRLTQTFKQKDGRREQLSPREVYDEVSRKLSTLIDQYGPRSIGLYYGTGTNQNPLNHALVKSWLGSTIGSPNLFSSITIDQSAKWVTAGRLGYFANGKYVGPDCEVALLVGTNPPVSHMGAPTCPYPSRRNPQSHLRQYQRDGHKLIVIDPRRTEIARRADLHLQIDPGEDTVVLAAMLNHIFLNGLENRDFLNRFATSVDALRALVQPITPELAAKRAKIPPAEIVEAAELFSSVNRASAFSGTGPDMSPHSNLAEHLIESLNVICGGYRKAGDLVTNRGLLFGAVPTVESVIPPTRAWERGARSLSANTGRVGGEFPTALLPGEILSDSPERIRALIVVGGNPVGALGEPALTQKAFKQLELVVTLDMRETETTELSDYVIAVKAPYEREDFTGMSDSHTLTPFAQYTDAVVEPLPSLIDDWEFFWETTQRMNRTLALKRPAIGLPDEAHQGTPLDMQTKPSTRELIAQLCELGGNVSIEELTAAPHGIGLPYEPVPIEPAQQDDGARLNVCPADVAEEFLSYLQKTPDAHYQFLLVCRRRLETMNSAYRNADRTLSKHPSSVLHMAPGDLELNKLKDGQLVQVTNANGSMRATVQSDPTLKAGVVSTFHMKASSPEYGVNNLVSLTDHLEAINFMPRQSSIPVNIRPLNEAVN